MMGKSFLKKVLIFAFVACYAFSLFSTVKVLASANIFKVEDVELLELSETSSGDVSVADDASITSNIVFKKLGDEAKVKIVLKNTSDADHVIKSITDNNDSPYVVYNYNSYENLTVNAGDSFDFIVTVKYQNQLADVHNRALSSSVRFSIKYYDIAEADDIDIDVPAVPDTSGKFVAPKNDAAIKTNVALLITLTVGLVVVLALVIRKHKKAAKLIATFAAVSVAATVVTTVSAATIETNVFSFNISYALEDRLIVTYKDGEGNTRELLVANGEKATLEDAEKTGYTFLGWEDENGNPFSLDTKITEDTTINPTFRANTYTISFNKTSGTGSMGNLSMTYDEEKQLTANAFTRTGYGFNGWNTSADGQGDSYTDSQTVKNLTATDGDSITLYAQWQPNTYTIVFDGNAPDSKTVEGEMADITMTYDTPLKLQNNTFSVQGYKFVSWNTKADGTGTTIYNGAQVNNLVESGSIKLYAIWKEKTLACKFATELHTEPCKNSSTGGCANNGGYAVNNTITYGTLAGDEPKAGDAYDCDVNFDGVYDSETERFYYLHTADNKAIMFYSKNLHNEDEEYPDALTYLPTTATWTNPNLTKFAENRVARFATVDDISLGCNGVNVMQNNALLACKYLLEDTSFGNTANSRRSTYMIEPDEDGVTYYRVHKNYRNIVTGNSTLHAAPRPVIEVDLSQVEGFSTGDDDDDDEEVDQVVGHDIASDAVKNYYASVSGWTSSESTFLAAMKNNYDSNNCKATSINPQISTDFPNEYRYSTTGTVFCDKPKGYDTGATGGIKVYLSDENTKVKGAEATYVSVKDGVLTNLVPGVTYLWESTAESSVHGFVKVTGDRRLIDLPTARNVRDLGGIAAAGGKKIQYGRILRGERLDANDVAALGVLKINKEYDVRSEDNGAHFATGFERHAMTNYDIMPTEESNYTGTREALTSLMNDIIAGNNIYIHCTHGSDRTGTLVYLAEALLGVSNEDRDRDYDLTALSGRPDRTRFYDHMAQSTSGFNPERKYVYLKTNLPDETAVREWYFHGSTNREADEQLIENFRNAILE